MKTEDKLSITWISALLIISLIAMYQGVPFNKAVIYGMVITTFIAMLVAGIKMFTDE